MKTLLKRKRKRAAEDTALQITSMADIFTIILVFLLKSYASGATSIAPALEMTLPDGKSKDTMKETLKVELNRDAILLDQKQVMGLTNFRFNPTTEIENGGSPVLVKAFETERTNQPLPNQVSDLLVLADERIPYSTLRTVMASAASAGFVDLQLVIVEEQE
jgi:biopolymer transport protein ExbD